MRGVWGWGGVLCSKFITVCFIIPQILFSFGMEAVLLMEKEHLGINDSGVQTEVTSQFVFIFTYRLEIGKSCDSLKKKSPWLVLCFGFAAGYRSQTILSTKVKLSTNNPRN